MHDTYSILFAIIAVHFMNLNMGCDIKVGIQHNFTLKIEYMFRVLHKDLQPNKKNGNMILTNQNQVFSTRIEWLELY